MSTRPVMAALVLGWLSVSSAWVEAAPGPEPVSVRLGAEAPGGSSSSGRGQASFSSSSSGRGSRRAGPAPQEGRVERSAQGWKVVGSPAPVNRYLGSDGRWVEIPSRTRLAELEGAGGSAPRPALASRGGRAIRGVLALAPRFLGAPYVWGGESPGGFDCSGYVQYLFRLQGVRLPRSADLQFQVGRPVPPGREQPGDLVFFETYAPGASHVGLYLGGGRFIHASSSGAVIVSELGEAFFQARYLGGRRIL